MTKLKKKKKLSLLSLLVHKHRENRKTLPWEHHIGCQMCQIALSKSVEKNRIFWEVAWFFFHYCNYCHCCHYCNFFFFFFLFLKPFQYFGKSYLTLLTTDVMFSGQHFAILAMFFVERLCDFVCGEVAWFFGVEMVHAFSHSLTPVAWFIFLNVAWFFFADRMRDFF